MSLIYVSGHRNPDTDSIASAMGYAELRGRLDPDNEYLAVRLGDCNAQTMWLLERSGMAEPTFLPHVMPRARDVMQTSFPVGGQDEPIREAGLAMAKADLELVPIVDEDGALCGVLTERALARRYIRESRGHVHARGGAHLRQRDRGRARGRARYRRGPAALRAGLGPVRLMWRDGAESPTGDVVVIGNRTDAQLLAIELGAALVVMSNGATPEDEVLALAREQGTALVVSPLDSYVSGRMITLAAPCRALMEKDALTVNEDFLVDDISEQIKEVHYGGAVAIDGDRKPVGPDHPLRPGRPTPAPDRARGPRRAGPERDRHRAGRDHRDPRSSPHRFD